MAAGKCSRNMHRHDPGVSFINDAYARNRRGNGANCGGGLGPDFKLMAMTHYS